MQDRDDTPAGALRSAAFYGQAHVVEHLLAEGVDPNIADRYGRTPLSLAAGAGHVAIARALLQWGAWADLIEDGSVFMSPLMTAAEGGHIEVVELLLDSGADPTRTGGYSICTAEYYARHQHPYVAAILFRAEDSWRRAHPRGASA